MNEIIVFTKLFKNKSLSDLVAVGQSYGLDGYDLCVRPGYLVNPDNVLESLVPAVKTLLNAFGIRVVSRANGSIPNITFVDFDAVFFAQATELVLK